MLGLSVSLPAALRASNDGVSRRIRACQDSVRTLPPSLCGKNAENDSLAGADSAHTDSFRLRLIKWRIEEPGNDVHTARLDLSTRRVLLEIDEILFWV